MFRDAPVPLLTYKMEGDESINYFLNFEPVDTAQPFLFLSFCWNLHGV